MSRRTRIVATLGPASRSPAVVSALIAAGMDVVRLNTSHGSIDEHVEMVRIVREVGESMNRHAGVMMDLSGPKLRTAPDTGTLSLTKGEEVTLTGRTAVSAQLRIPYTQLGEEIGPGERVLLDDGAVSLEVLHADGNGDVLLCRANNSGVIIANKGVAFPDSELSLPAITPRDEMAIAAGVAAGVDFFALSFVQVAADILRAQELVRQAGGETQIIAKIERRVALKNIDGILALADGAMVARGDLGVELAPEDVPIEQRRIIRAASAHLVPVITATQMLESMIHSPRPTRAEASDVANAVWARSDALMLSAETAIGEYPVQAVAMMDRLIRRAEDEPTNHVEEPRFATADDHSYVIALAARQIVGSDKAVRAVVCFTRSGRTARLLSKVHPGAPIIAFSPNVATCRQLRLARGVEPILAVQVETSEEMLAMTDRLLVERGMFKVGDEVVVVASLPVRTSGQTNFLKLHRIGESADYA